MCTLGVLGQMLGIELTETVEEEKERLSMMSKEELIEHLLKAKVNRRLRQAYFRGAANTRCR